jgi:signal peptidase I
MKKKLLNTCAIVLGMAFALTGLYSELFLNYIKVPTGGMSNTIIPGDRLIVSKRIGAISRGDLIVFRYPKDPKTKYLKRVIGLPGETIDIKRAKVFINGKELPEKHFGVEFIDYQEATLKIISGPFGDGNYSVYYDQQFLNEDFDNGIDTYELKFPYEIPQDQYFVMGDNRNNSQDSRYWGCVPKDLIVGKPFMIYWSSNTNNSGEIRWNRILMDVK